MYTAVVIERFKRILESALATMQEQCVVHNCREIVDVGCWRRPIQAGVVFALARKLVEPLVSAKCLAEGSIANVRPTVYLCAFQYNVGTGTLVPTHALYRDQPILSDPTSQATPGAQCREP